MIQDSTIIGDIYIYIYIYRCFQIVEEENDKCKLVNNKTNRKRYILFILFFYLFLIIWTHLHLYNYNN